MHQKLLLIPLALTIAISGCTLPMEGTSRSEVITAHSMSFQAGQHEEAVILEQTASLEVLMQDIIRKSTVKHAAMGAAVGCGVSVLAASGASGCLKAAAAGGVLGAIGGNIAGNRDVERRMELISANALVQSIRRSNDKLGSISADLPEMLAQQDTEIKALLAQKNSGTIDTADYSARLAHIRASRVDVAEALLMTSRQAKIASDNLRQAADQGQTGLEWHMSAINQIERETLSARSQISLL